MSTNFKSTNAQYTMLFSKCLCIRQFSFRPDAECKQMLKLYDHFGWGNLFCCIDWITIFIMPNKHKYNECEIFDGGRPLLQTEQVARTKNTFRPKMRTVQSSTRLPHGWWRQAEEADILNWHLITTVNVFWLNGQFISFCKPKRLIKI